MALNLPAPTAFACAPEGFSGACVTGEDTRGAEGGAPWLTTAEAAEACAEGWSLFMHFGDIVELRLERIDCSDEGEGALPDDAAAWLRVWTRATALHLKVIGILKASSPAEHARIEAFVYGLEACPALA